MCPYNANIPQPDDLLNASQDDLLQNFIALKAAIDINHGTFGAADEGMHKFVSIPTNVNPTNPIPDADDLVAKVRTSALTNFPELGYQRTGSTRLFPLTVRQNNLQNFELSYGWATLGGNNLIIKWGLSSSTGVQGWEFPAGPGIPQFSAIPYHMTILPFAPAGFNPDVFVQLSGITTATSFVVRCLRRTTNEPALVPFFYIAIGPT